MIFISVFALIGYAIGLALAAAALYGVVAQRWGLFATHPFIVGIACLVAGWPVASFSVPDYAAVDANLLYLPFLAIGVAALIVGWRRRRAQPSG